MGRDNRLSHSVQMDPFYFRFKANKGTNADPVPSGGSVVLSWETANVVPALPLVVMAQLEGGKQTNLSVSQFKPVKPLPI